MKIISLLAKFIVTTALFYWLIKSNKFRLDKVFDLNLNTYTLLFFVSIFLHLFVQSIRWKFILNYYKIFISTIQAITISWIGNFFSLFLPGASSGEFFRGYYLYRLGSKSMARSVSSLVLDRIIGFFTFAIISLISCCYLVPKNSNLHLNYIFFLNFLLVILLFCVILGLTSKKAHKVLKRTIPDNIYEKISLKIILSDDCQKEYIPVAVVLSMVSTGFAIVGFILSSVILQQPVDFSRALLYAPIIIMSNTLPISPGGLGVAESVSSLLFSQCGYPHGAEVMFLYRLGMTLLRLPGGIAYLLYKRG